MPTKNWEVEETLTWRSARHGDSLDTDFRPRSVPRCQTRQHFRVGGESGIEHQDMFPLPMGDWGLATVDLASGPGKLCPVNSPLREAADGGAGPSQTNTQILDIKPSAVAECGCLVHSDLPTKGWHWQPHGAGGTRFTMCSPQ